MTAQKGWRKLLATVTTGLLVIGGLATAPLAANAAETPALSATVTAASETGLSVSTQLTGVEEKEGYNGAYIVIVEADQVDSLKNSMNYLGGDWIRDISSGSANLDVRLDAAKIDRTKEYVAVSWRAHAYLSDESFLAQTDISISDEQWDKVFASTTTAKVSFKPTTFAYNVAKTATVKVTADNGATPTGTVTVTINSKKYTKKLSGGKASIKLTKPANVSSKRAVSVVYTSNSPKFPDSKKTTTYVKITKAKPSLSVKLNKSKVSTKQKAKAAISVKVPGSLGATAKGLKVTVYDGSKKLKTAKLNSKGKVNVTIPKLKKGTHKIKVKFSGSSNISSKTKTVTLKVK